MTAKESLEFITSKCCLAVKYAFKDELKTIETALSRLEELEKVSRICKRYYLQSMADLELQQGNISPEEHTLLKEVFK